MAEMQNIIEEYFDYLSNKTFPCVAARAALRNEHIRCMVALNMACPNDDPAILKFLYDFVNEYRNETTSFHSAAIIFQAPSISSEEMFEALFWKRLQSLSNLDAVNYSYDIRVDADPASGNFSFSIKEEAFFIIGLHPFSSRQSRKFKYPALVFNPHAEFEKLRLAKRYEQMKNVVRKRDIAYSGSINPMLKDFGESSEVYQYSGRDYDSEWQCPLKINHANKNNSSA
jgi:FPC/CPF motif-containing protein YcgG